MLFKAVNSSEPRKRHSWERTTFLVRTTDDHSALEKAEHIARGMEHEYEAIDSRLVRWEFQSIEKVQKILDDELTEGTEVCWEFFERVDKR